MLNVHLHSLGCRLNEAELLSWGRALSAKGHRLVDTAEHADVIVLNSCAVTLEAARKSRQLIQRLRRQNHNAKLVLTGCYASLPQHSTELAQRVDVLLPNSAKEQLVEHLDQLFPTALSPNLTAAPSTPSTTRRTRAFVKVQDGCRHRCSYCIVTIARGEERSRPIAELVAEIQALVAQGYQEIVLTGVHIGGYGSDLGTTLGALIEAILRHTNVPRLRLSSLEPWEIAPAFWQLWQDHRLCPHLHLPLQSGSDRILRRMCRRTNQTAFRALVAQARAAIPQLVLSTDIIVGFPGEAESDFAETMNLCSDIGFAHIHVFPFSAREGTTAATLSHPVPAAQIERRASELRHEAARLRRAVLERHLGTVRPVLWEGRGKLGNDGHRTWQGLTDTYLRVQTRVPADLTLRNQLHPTQLQAIGPREVLFGELCAEDIPNQG